MTTQKRKVSAEKKKLLPICFLLILLTFLAGAVLIIVYIYLPKSSIGLPRPAYEEIYTTTDNLHRKIRDIDYAIYESLYQSGIQEKNIFFLNVLPRNEKGSFWDFTELLIKCPDVNSASLLERNMALDISALGEKVNLRNEKGPDGRMITHVYTEGFYTHKVDIVSDSQHLKTDDVRPKVAIIIDDLGYDSKIASSLIQLDFPLSFSVLPCAPFTKRIAAQANKEGCELMLHLPMEPRNFPSVNPGPGALFVSMEVLIITWDHYLQ
jgi:hypothetical protein